LIVFFGCAQNPSDQAFRIGHVHFNLQTALQILPASLHIFLIFSNVLNIGSSNWLLFRKAKASVIISSGGEVSIAGIQFG
jgi:hypothetical protein